MGSVAVLKLEHKVPSIKTARRRAARWGLSVTKQEDGKYAVLRTIRETHRERLFKQRYYEPHDVHIISRHMVVGSLTIPEILNLCTAIDVAAREAILRMKGMIA